ncbi:MAG: thioredoxin domain-containing protein, partial [Verrucomicrobiae bacterium]|nr:thioredoxin domain-containing protein [Verrucomicrobiae bacterium]NNJ87198.1 thioredoxin domain-containing protein [Akkermansiaceae bacterium]
MSKSSSIKPFAKWLIVLLATTAFLLSLWLTIQKLTGKIDSLAGCGTGSGCANVLGSKWSMVLGVVPVSVFSCLLYLAVIGSLWLKGAVVEWFRMLAAWILIGAAAWFTALQLFVLLTICPYCMVMHSLGVLLGCAMLYAERSGGKSSARPARLKRVMTSLPLAVVMVAGLAAIQYYGPEPETHRVDDVEGPENSPSQDAGIHAAGEGRLVTFFDGGKSFRVDTLPHIGSLQADNIIVKYYDYTCEACRDAHNDLERIIAKYPGKLAAIVLPVPINRQCNPNLPVGVKDHQNACELAKLSLRVWRADRSKFREFHKWLFEYHDQPYEAAEAMAYSLVGMDAMDAVDSKWVDAVLAANIADYKE